MYCSSQCTYIPGDMRAHVHLFASHVIVFGAVAPDDHHVMQNGVMYAVVNKKRKPASTDGKRDTTILADGKRKMPASTDGKRDTPTSTNTGTCNSSKPSGYDGYEEIEVDFAMARTKDSHHVSSSAG